jgi:lipopolysaccharide/colanic/teichoic acid biosynthesis glycosyltransferase
MKRILDIIISFIGLWILALMIPFVALAITLDSKGSIFYRGVRVGKDGRLFKIIKFRTMIDGADQCGPKLTYRNDPRITKMGAILRRLKIDELPQFINVFLGQMSLVGCRSNPESPEPHPFTMSTSSLTWTPRSSTSSTSTRSSLKSSDSTCYTSRIALWGSISGYCGEPFSRSSAAK